jgi:hypothetical protein
MLVAKNFRTIELLLLLLLLLLLYTVRYVIYSLRSFFPLALIEDFLYVTPTKDFPLRGPDYQVIRTTPPPYSSDDRGTTVLTGKA